MVTITPVGATIIAVDINGEGNYSSIQEAINSAQNGDTILVGSGIYQENIKVNKELKILSGSSLSGSQSRTYVIGAIPKDNVFDIYSSNVTIDGFYISGGSLGTDRLESGIYLEEVKNCSLSNNTLIQNNQGISLNGSQGNYIVSNLVSLGSYGIYLVDSDENLLSNNLVISNDLGISLNSSANTTIVNNTVSFNTIGVSLETSQMNMLAHNLVSKNKYGTLCQASESNNLINNSLHLNNIGVYFNESSNNTVYHNDLVNLINAMDEESNFWNSSSTGNFWNDYTGQDADRNSIGDIPYAINQTTGSMDYMPLVNETFSDNSYELLIHNNNLISLLNEKIFAKYQNTLEKGVVIEATELGQINTSLQEGPVFLRLGAEWCPMCQSMKPIVKELAAEYGGKVTVMSVNLNQNPEFATYFGVDYIPDSFVIVGIENGKYVYMQENGDVTTDRFKVRIVGLRDKGVFEKLLNLSLLNEMKNKST